MLDGSIRVFKTFPYKQNVKVGIFTPQEGIFFGLTSLHPNRTHRTCINYISGLHWDLMFGLGKGRVRQQFSGVSCVG